MAKKNTDKSIIRTVVLTLAVLLVYLFFLAGPEDIRKSRVDYSTGTVGEITSQSTVEADIYSSRANLNSVEIRYATYGRINYSNLEIALKDADDNLIKVWNVDCSSLEDNSFVTYYLDEPLSDSCEVTYYLTITSDAEPGNGVTISTCGDNVLYRVGHKSSAVWEVLSTVLSLLPFVVVPFVLWKSRNNYWATAYAFYIMMVLVMHYYMPTNTQDDLFMSRANDGYTAMSWAVWKWNTWSSRFLQEFFGFIVVNRPMLWKTIDAAMFALFPYLINRSLSLRAYDRLFSLWALPLYPILDQVSAGWMCTTMTYIWPVFTALLATAILRDVMDGRRIKWFEYPLFFFSLIYASNHELMAIYLLGILVYCAVVARKEYKSKRVFVWSAVAVSIINFVVIMLCPGTKIRGDGEAVLHFGNYVDYNLFDKVFLGVNRCLDIFISRPNASFLVLSAIVTAGVFLKTNITWKRIVAMIPTISWIAIHALFQTTLTGELMWLHYFTARGLMLMMFGVVLLGSIVFSIFEIYSDKTFITKQGSLVALIFVMGMATTAAMGFSPTIYASAPRTSTFTYYGIIVAIVALISKVCKDKKVSEKSVVPISIVCFVVIMGIRVMNVIGITIV